MLRRRLRLFDHALADELLLGIGTSEDKHQHVFGHLSKSINRVIFIEDVEELVWVLLTHVPDVPKAIADGIGERTNLKVALQYGPFVDWVDLGQIYEHLLVLFVFDIGHEAALNCLDFLIEHPVKVGLFEGVHFTFLAKASTDVIDYAHEVNTLGLKSHELRRFEQEIAKRLL